MQLKRTEHNLNPQPTWGTAIDVGFIPHARHLANFDQNGYDLTPLEHMYAEANNGFIANTRWRNSLKTQWYEDIENSIGGVHLNHADLYERKGYHGYALEQLMAHAEGLPLIHKITQMRPKWGIDISIDYVSYPDVFEVFHFEWDDFNYEVVAEKQIEIEKVIENTDFDDAAQQLIKRKDEWHHLDFFAQSKWKADYFGVSEEQFKMVAWRQFPPINTCMFDIHNFTHPADLVCTDHPGVDLDHRDFNWFDSKGFRLNAVEQAFYRASEYHIDADFMSTKMWATNWLMRTEYPIWDNFILNHSYTAYRCNYRGPARDHIMGWADNKEARNLLNIRPKWGFVLNLTYIDDDKHFEMINIHYDSYIFKEFNDVRRRIEDKIVGINWLQEAEYLWDKRDDWRFLSSNKQDDWKAKYLLDMDDANRTLPVTII